MYGYVLFMMRVVDLFFMNNDGCLPYGVAVNMYLFGFSYMLCCLLLCFLFVVP